MKVTLIQGTDNAIPFLADIASICYGHKEAKNPTQLVMNLLKLGHHSVFEHAVYTFKIEGVSRACLGQLTRHRHASYTVRSQRYCDESEQDFIVPEKLLGNLSCGEINYLDVVRELYDRLIRIGIKREDARMILPMATSTDLYMTLNLRELMHIADLRIADDAQQEINDLVTEMVKLVVIYDEGIGNVFSKPLK